MESLGARVDSKIAELERLQERTQVLLDSVEYLEKRGESLPALARTLETIEANLGEEYPGLLARVDAVEERLNCPSGMKDAGTFCIDPEPTIERGTSWFDAGKLCLERGRRMCTVAEASSAVRAGLTKRFSYSSEGNHWVWVDDAVLTRSEGPNVTDACHVQLNFDEHPYQLGEWNCQISALSSNPNIGGVCCK